MTIICTLAVGLALAVGLWGKRDAFVSALGDAPAWMLAAAALLQLVWLVARSEAWHVCVDAAGGEVSRRRLYRAAAVGYLGNLFNSSFGLGVRIAALRRSAPDESPCVSVLVAAEAPIIVVEMALVAICSFTLVGPLGLAWWAPIIFIAAGLGVIVAVTRIARDRHDGFWAGIAVMRGLGGRNTIIGLVVFAVLAQVARNWVVLHGLGVDISVFDSMALLIAAAIFGLLPVGPTLGVATSVVILGANGVAVAAAAGALLTATGAVGALGFAAWALVDRLAQGRRPPAVALPSPVAKPAPAASA
ncbi:MAG: hypothetical protein QOI10_217 [Solirubrobacterales bacterium]|nr:hypothetical protein [Solirubrobacterales bacterium]